MRSLNPEQREAIHYLDGPLLVLAGAGSGKTRVITEKIAYLVNSCGFAPAEVAAITFTNKAAREMKDRAGKLLSGKVTGLQISTFHALGMRILREEARALGYKPNFSIFDANDCLNVLAELAASVDKGKLRLIQSLISRWKNARILSDAPGAVTPETPAEKLAWQIYPSYEATLRAYQAVDFDDLIALPGMLLEREPALAEKWRRRFRYVLIDEYQDTNSGQYQLLWQLTGERRQFTAVGDDDQSIYGWRGADIANLRRLSVEIPNLKVIKLEQNYRSTTRILGVANNVISHNENFFEKKLWSNMGEGDPVSVSFCADNAQEADSVVKRLVADHLLRRGKWSDYAILYRSNHLARLFEERLIEERVPYFISGGASFFDKAEIKDILAYLRLLSNPEDDPAFIRAVSVPRRGIGASTLRALGAYAGERRISIFSAAGEMGASARLTQASAEALGNFCAFLRNFSLKARAGVAGEVLEALLEAIGYERFLYDHEEERIAAARWANVLEFRDWFQKKSGEDGKTLLELAQTIALMTMIEQNENGEEQDAVRLSTLHAAKGLEYPHVFLVGVEEGILPHREAVESGHIEEERRLMYVGITRARRTLHISCCARRRARHEVVAVKPSRFIEEMGKEGVRIRGGKDEPLPDQAARAAKIQGLRAILAQNRTRQEE
ncbi:MAG: UvrD-helicase domain-containing protein [Zoogloeaceae bacterium]|jgi:ATP-dependent DNA helicase Rep|nr:UvrD-helicase domain-containing protein [Zoogloeaceae bacterium]